MAEDDINWKYNNQISDQAAQNCNLYGKVNDPFSIAMAKNETQRLREEEFYKSLPKGPYISGSGDLAGLMKFLGIVVTIGLIIFVIAMADVWTEKYHDHVMSSKADQVMSLDTAYYEKLSPEAAKMSIQSTAQLYGSVFPDEVMGTQEMSYYGSEKLAVHAAWIRYTKDPESFFKLPKKNQYFIFYTFEAFLESLANEGDANAFRDLREFKELRLER